jgi:hypothetical protein
MPSGSIKNQKRWMENSGTEKTSVSNNCNMLTIDSEKGLVEDNGP